MKDCFNRSCKILGYFNEPERETWAVRAAKNLEGYTKKSTGRQYRWELGQWTKYVDQMGGITTQQLFRRFMDQDRFKTKSTYDGIAQHIVTFTNRFKNPLDERLTTLKRPKQDNDEESKPYFPDDKLNEIRSELYQDIMRCVVKKLEPDWYKIGLLFIADTGARVNEASTFIMKPTLRLYDAQQWSKYTFRLYPKCTKT